MVRTALLVTQANYPFDRNTLTGPRLRVAPDIWFTDQALHLQVRSGPVVVPYDELAAVTLEATLGTRELRVGDLVIGMRGDTEGIAGVINAVKAAVIYQETGLGDPPPVHLFSGAGASYDSNPSTWGFWTTGVTALLAVVLVAEGIHAGLDSPQFGPLAAGWLAGTMVGLS